MRKFVSIISLMFCVIIVVVAQNPREEFIKASKEKYNTYKKEQEEAYKRFTDKQNEEYANFIEESWQLYEDFKKQESPFSEPKFKEAPIAPNADKIDLSMFRDMKDAVVDFVVKIFSSSSKNKNSAGKKESMTPNSRVQSSQQKDSIAPKEQSLPASEVKLAEEKDGVAPKEQSLPASEVKLAEEKDGVAPKEQSLPASEVKLAEEKDGVAPKEQSLPASEVKLAEEKDGVAPKEQSLPASEVKLAEEKDGVAPKDQSLLASDMRSSGVEIDFYGEKLFFNFDDKLKIKTSGLSESDVASYFSTISKLSKETSALWSEIMEVSDKFGLNDWGNFLLLQKISEQCFQDINDRVLFCFYMLRNEGLCKVKVARGRVSNNLVLMMALDNSKDVYKYGYFVFAEADTKVKYYLVYGAGREEKSVYTYAENKQDIQLAQVKLDFDKTLSIGSCDRVRELNVRKLDKTISLPFNSSNIAYLNDVPQTSFPVYFVSSLPLETQDVLTSYFGNLKNEYSVVEATGILLNFVQMSFNYKTDGDQFGYEKYFYPEESLAYPYCDCEDRSALFGWLVRTYLGLPVIGLQYPGHLATAVCFGSDVTITGTAFTYGGKKYYVCDPTYLGASIGMAMPEFKSVVPKVIKLKNL